MTIEHIYVDGYRSLVDVTWQPASLNVLIGPNRSGKSNLLRALTLVAQLAQKRLSKALTAEGGIHQVLWDGRHPSLRMFMALNPSNGSPSAYQFELQPMGSLSSYRFVYESLIAPKTAAEKQESPIQWYLDERGNTAIGLRDKERRDLRVVLHRQGNTATIRHEGLPETRVDEVPDEEALISLSDHPLTLTAPQVRKVLSQFSMHSSMDVGVDSSIRRAAVTRTEKRLGPDGDNLVAVLHTHYTGNRGFESLLDESMRAAFGPDYEKLLFPPAEDNRVQMRIRWSSLERQESAADMSDGTLRFLFLVAALCMPDPPPLVAIDEPETGLHPSMFPIVAELAEEAAGRTQVILTTHSPDFLDAFTEKDASTTVLLNQDGKTVLRKTEGEQLRKWLERYRLGDLWRSGELEDLGE